MTMPKIRHSRKSRLVPEPPSRPLGPFRYLKQIRDDQIAVFSRDDFVNDIGITKLLGQHFFLLNSPDYIKYVLLTNSENYPKSRLNRQLLRPVLGDGLLTSGGEFWRRQRRIAAPAFHHRRLSALAGTITQCAEEMIERWRSADDRRGAPDISVEMTALAMQIVTRTLFSRDIVGSVHELGKAISVIVKSLGKPSIIDLVGLPEWLPRRRDSKTVEAIAAVERTIYDIIAERRANPSETRDLLSMLLEARDEETGEGMTDRQLRDEAMTLFAAGHETTGTALTWTWYLLSQHPEVERRLHEELRIVLGGRTPSFGDLEALTFTRMVFEEAMRLFPPVIAFNREALSDDVIDGQKIPAGAMVKISPYVTHRNPKLWPNPSRFDPDRFMPDRARVRYRYSYLPFGGGPRICIGNSFAMMEAQLILATVAQAFRLQLLPGHPVEAKGQATLRPRWGLLMTLQPRDERRQRHC